MNKVEFLKNTSVQNFVEWIGYILDDNRHFNHNFQFKKNPKNSHWSCDSIYNAYEQYRWGSASIESIKIDGVTMYSNYNTNKKILDNLSSDLRGSVSEGNDMSCKDICKKILEWGNVSNKNADRIDRTQEITNYLSVVASRLDSNTYDTNHKCNDIIMNSGYTKIYSLLLNDFIIYDSRVAAGLGLLVRLFCESTSLFLIPDTLNFAYGNSRNIHMRNAGRESYEFNKLRPNDVHTKNNMKANWLLKEILKNHNSRFNSLNENDQLRAFEAALFMIGYDVSQKK